MAKKYFGTDGIRGKANAGKMTPEVAMKVGQAVGVAFQRGQHRHRVVIGKDTRLSGYMVENAMVAGFTSAGMDVFLLGPVPTPAVAMLTRSLRADIGVMISASHNPFYDNGIKLFGPDGYKLSDSIENRVEAMLDEDLTPHVAPGDRICRATRFVGDLYRYIEAAKRSFPRQLSLSGMRVVIDCANGAAYKVAPSALYELGAEVFKIGVNPDGFNINQEVGSTDTGALKEAVQTYRADIGIALDGDADRCIIIDEKGDEIDGDQLIGLIAAHWKTRDRLAQPGVVTTVMSNLGLEKHLEGIGLSLERTKVGDRYVVERMRKGGFNLGGEQSGHIVMSDYSTTGDGLMAALQVLAVMVEKDKPLSEIAHVFDPVPQKLVNVRYKSGAPLEEESVRDAIAAAEKKLGKKGRLVIRKSGTEPLIRVMAEATDAKLMDGAVESVADAVRAIS